MLFNAYQGGVPLVVTVGQQDTRLIAREPALCGNLVRIAEPFTKWAYEINYTEDIPMIMYRAFKVAKQSPSGPVMISLPQNALNRHCDFEFEKGADLFTGLQPEPESIKSAVKLRAEARNPVRYIEDGITKNNALNEVVEFAETIGAKVYQHWMADVNFPVRHALYMGDINLTTIEMRYEFEKVDVLVVIGAPLFAQPLPLPRALIPPSTKIIQIDNNPWQMAKNFPIVCGIEGNIKTALNGLTEAIKKQLSEGDIAAINRRIIEISTQTMQIKKNYQEADNNEKDNVPIAASRLMNEINQAIKPGTRIIDDCWSNSPTLRRILDLKEAGQYQRARQGGSIGYGLPGAMGAKLGSDKNTPVVAIVGDGSAAWSIQSLWTAAHYNIPVTFIVLSNRSYQQVRKMKHLVMGEIAKGRYLGTNLDEPEIDFYKLAESLGISAQKADKPEQLSKVLANALKSNKPNLIEVVIEMDIK